jgi:hypothetical protein
MEHINTKETEAFMKEEILELLQYKDRISNGALSFEEFKLFLEKANAILRNKNIGDDDTGIYLGFMSASDLISPTNEVQLEVLKKYYDSLKSIENSKAKSALSYYTMLNLHLFSDGNGRLARFMYQIFDKDFDMDYVIHSESDLNIKGRNFEEDKNILLIDYVNNLTASVIFGKLVQSGQITDDERLKQFIAIRTRASGIVGDHSGLAIPEDIKSQLSEQEVNDLNRNLLNNNSSFTVSGITMCIILSRLGKLPSALDINDKKIQQLKTESRDECLFSQRSRSLVFNIGNKKIEEARENFEGWTVDTFRQANKVSEYIHQYQLETLVDIFLRPREYMIDKNNTILSQIINEGFQDRSVPVNKDNEIE